MKPFNGALFTLLLVSIAFAGCKKKTESTTDPNGLPKAGQTGAMIFACKINGANWISNKSVNSIGGSAASEIVSVHGINDSRNDGFLERLDIQVAGAVAGATYKLNDPAAKFATYTTNLGCSVSPGMGQIKSADGEITFTKIDKLHRIISGVFTCIMLTEKCGQVEITEGRFDISY